MTVIEDCSTTLLVAELHRRLQNDITHTLLQEVAQLEVLGIPQSLTTYQGNHCLSLIDLLLPRLLKMLQILAPDPNNSVCTGKPW